MAQRFPFWPAVAFVAACAATVVAQNNPPGPQQPPAAPARPIKVGVVDIGQLFRDYKRKDQLETQVNQNRERIKADLDADAENIRRMRRALDTGSAPPGSPQWEELRDEIKQANFVWEMKTQRLQDQLKKQVEEMTLQILTELETTIAAYGRRHGYDLILKSDKDLEDTGGQQGELQQQFQERIFRAQISDVLYNAEGVDITPHVKQMLNAAENITNMERLAREREARRNAPTPPPATATEQQPPQTTTAPPQRGG
jgi:Skp family chaperone for outer membrane proteins